MNKDADDALFMMEGEICDLSGARATLSKLADGCHDDSELQDSLFFVAGMIGASVNELRRLWDVARGHRPDTD